MYDVINYAQHGVTLLLVALNVAGLIVCVVHSRLSSSMFLPMLGFGGAALVGLLRMTGPLFFAVVEYYEIFNLALSIAAAVCLLLIVAGLGLVFGDVGRRLYQNRDRDRPDDSFRRRPGYGDEDRPGYDPRNPGSRDVTR
jgi:hypothetical protein